jgi:hypothetical protein
MNVVVVSRGWWMQSNLPGIVLFRLDIRMTRDSTTARRQIQSVSIKRLKRKIALLT